MISFDRSGNVNLTPLWNEINSIKSDTVSMWNYVSTLSGGGGGNYYLNIDDVLSSSLKYVYNMTGDITAIPTYDSFTFHGNIGNLSSLNIDNSIKNFEIGDINSIENLIISASLTSLTYKDIKLIGKTMKSATFRNIMNCNLSFTEILSCSLNSIYYFPVFCNVFSANTCTNCYATINANNISYNSLSANVGVLNCQHFSKNTISKNNQYINAINISSNTFITVSNYELKARAINRNSFFCGLGNGDICCTPNFICSQFYSNTIDNILNDFNIDCLVCSGNYIHNTTLYGTDTINNSRLINIKGLNVYANYITNVYNINVDCVSLRGRWSFSDVNSIKFKAKSVFWGAGHGADGVGPNYMTNVGCLDIHEITYGFYVNSWSDYIIGVSTFKFNYNISWTNPIGGTIPTPPIQPSNFYTLDFYNCDDYTAGSTFTIPSIYSGYDEGNVWISGKPLSELGYTLSISS